MNDLISRSALIETLVSTESEVMKNAPWDAEWFTRMQDRQNEIIGLIERAPAVEAVPMRHGQWNGEGDGYADGEIVIDVWYCSECDYCIDDGTDEEYMLPNFCPNCGADMRRGR